MAQQVPFDLFHVERALDTPLRVVNRNGMAEFREGANIHLTDGVD